MSNKQFHLQLIQDIISRLAKNSFLIKGWDIAILSAVIALSTKSTRSVFIFSLYLPTMMFWILDAYYLRQEKLYRNLYGKIVLLHENEICFDLIIPDFEKKETKYINSFLSLNIILFHGVILISVTALIFILYF